jgi:DNA-binding NtrC family response regulator
MSSKMKNVSSTLFDRSSQSGQGTRMPTVLVVDDDRTILLLAKKALSPIADIFTAETAQAGLEAIRGGSFDAVLLDIQLPDRSGLAAYCEIREIDSKLPVIFMTTEAASNTAIEAMQLGVFDYLAKPLAVDSLRDLVDKAIEQRKMTCVPVALSAAEGKAADSSELFIGRSKAMLDVFKDIGRVSKQDVPILIRGESGTGKELVARARCFSTATAITAPF